MKPTHGACHPESGFADEGSALLATSNSSPLKGLRLGVTLSLFAIRVYQQFISPLMPLGCRYYPTCSHYAAEAIERHGALHGIALGARRILRCHPFTRGGFDPVPDALRDPARTTALHKEPAR